MSVTEFPVGHPVIRRGDVCRRFLEELVQRGEEFIGLYQVRVVAPDNLMVSCLAHKVDGKLMFLLCKACAMCGKIQRTSCCHDEKEQSWVDTYTSIDMKRALLVGYKVVRYFEIWHYAMVGKKFFKDFILNIVKRKVECSRFLLSCVTKDPHKDYLKQLREQSGIEMT